MKDILCFFGFHKFGKWESVGMIGNNNEKLKRKCFNCGKLDFYNGMVEKCIESGEKSPYVFKN